MDIHGDLGDGYIESTGSYVGYNNVSGIVPAKLETAGERHARLLEG